VSLVRLVDVCQDGAIAETGNVVAQIEGHQ
jgi:hypothetical protein